MFYKVTSQISQITKFFLVFPISFFIFMREFLLNLILFNIVDLFVEIGQDHPLALAFNQVDPDHRKLICKNREFAGYKIDGIIT